MYGCFCATVTELVTKRPSDPQAKIFIIFLDLYRKSMPTPALTHSSGKLSMLPSYVFIFNLSSLSEHFDYV